MDTARQQKAIQLFFINANSDMRTAAGEGKTLFYRKMHRIPMQYYILECRTVEAKHHDWETLCYGKRRKDLLLN